MNKIGERLRDIRKKKGLSQEEMAELLGKSRSAYARIEENGEHLPISELKKISEKLQLPIYEIDPDLDTYNADKGIGVIFNYYIVNINQDAQNIDPSKLDVKIKELQDQIESLVKKIEDLAE
jgi:transcriptional regulator with XRE-family HTH domain